MMSTNDLKNRKKIREGESCHFKLLFSLKGMFCRPFGLLRG